MMLLYLLSTGPSTEFEGSLAELPTFSEPSTELPMLAGFCLMEGKINFICKSF